MMTDYNCLVTTSSSDSDFLEGLLVDCEREARDFADVKLIKRENRTVVWNICNMLGCETRGVPGQACRLFEHYMYKFISGHKNISGTNAQQALIQTIVPRLLLIITCCVQLAAKMNSSDSSYSASLIRVALLIKGASYTTEEIITTEADIFKTLDFRVPLWTSVDMVELLATKLKLATDVIKTITQVVDLAQYHQAEIEDEIIWVAKLPHRNAGSCVLTLHLSAGAVATAVRLYHHQTDPAPSLAQLLRISCSYIECIRDVILHVLLANEKTPRSLKRKFISS